ncbi:hypothetical protein RMATCC62417_17328 [Rhizopus microsporus]|nr:hypothetical protein RMATCC62417_17328 [Rhizopus microsporus]
MYPLAVDCRSPSLFAHTQTSLFKNTTFEASDDDFHETPLLRKGLPFVKKLNTSKYRSLKENTLAAINSKRSLEITSKPKNIDKKDIDAVQNFIKTVQARIQDKAFMPLKYTDPRGPSYFSLLPLYKVDSKSIQIGAQSFWKLAKQCDNKIKPGQKCLQIKT